jgi:hypothetical protein
MTVQSWDIVIVEGLDESKPSLARVLIAVSENRHPPPLFILTRCIPLFPTYRAMSRIQ